MIFVAVGTQFSFDRLIQYMDEWQASDKNITNEEVIVQISDGEYLPKNCEYHAFMDGEQYNNKIKNASVFVSHAGMGNIISARENQTPIIVLNRQFTLGEHRNDHQADGLKWMAKLAGVYTASTQQELYQHLVHIDQLKTAESAHVGNQQLTDYIADFINADISNKR
ncbi:MAG: glycosyltransferase [Cocleimonas sp.]